LVGGLGHVLSGAIVTGEIATRVIPNEGIRRSLWNAFLFGLAGVLVGVLVGGLFFGLLFLVLELVAEPLAKLGGVLFFGLLFGLFLGLFLGLINGGFTCFRHFNLRFLLWRKGSAPWRYVRFLDYAAERVFLRKVGGGYIFVHRMLLEYFAALHPSHRASPGQAPVSE